MTESVLRLLLLLRFCCFIAVVYLGLHMLCLWMVTKPDSKLLWFFSVVTAPLLRPVRPYLPADVSLSRLLRVALAVYSALWFLVMIATQQTMSALR